MPEPIAEFFRQNQWANTTLIDACRGLPDEHLDATVEGVYGSIRSTLQHIVSSETGYANRLAPESVDKLKWDDPWPGFDRLAELAQATGATFVGVAGSVSDDPIRVGTQQQYDVEPVVILTQMFNHGTEHRSQVATILTTLGLEPPEMSGWEWGLAAGKMKKV